MKSADEVSGDPLSVFWLFDFKYIELFLLGQESIRHERYHKQQRIYDDVGVSDSVHAEIRRHGQGGNEEGS
jgi:hypothetical protein